MHELSILTEILATALDVAKKNNATRVTKITLRVGALSGIVPYFCRSMFETIAEGTPAEGCEMIIENEPAVFKCYQCGHLTTYEHSCHDYQCEECHGNKIQLISGYKFQLVNIGIV